MIENTHTPTFDPEVIESNKLNIEDFICSICTLLPNPNLSIEEENCGHLFCKKCIDDWMKKSNKCPICNNIIKQRDIKNNNKFLFRSLSSLIIKCEECNWKGELSNYENHKENEHKKVEKKNNELKFELNNYYEVKIHLHPLLYISDNNEFKCSGKLYENCKNKNNEHVKLICCDCNYNLCIHCAKKYLIKKIEPIKIHEKINYKKDNYYDLFLIHEHPLKYLDIDNNKIWCCDGKKLNFKCFSKINNYSQTKNIPRFNCNLCNFNLCNKCAEAYFNLGNYKEEYVKRNCVIF